MHYLMLRCRNENGTDVNEKHARFKERMGKAVQGEWDVGLSHWPARIEFGRDEGRFINLRKHAPKAVRGEIHYVYRNKLGDEPFYDDYFCLDYDPRRVDHETIARIYFPKYVWAFEPYHGYLYDPDVGLEVFKRIREIKLNARHEVGFLWPVNYFDGKLCRSAFGKSPEDILKLLDGKVEKAELLLDGIYIVLSSNICNRDQMMALNDKWMPVLKS